MLVVDRQLHGEAEGHAARNDGDFVHGVGAGSHGGDESVAGFVVRGVFLLLVGKNHGLALDAHEDFVFGHFEIGHADELAVLARGPEGGFVDEIFEVGAGEAGSAASDDGKIDVVGKRLFTGVNAENFLATLDVRASDDDAAIEAAGAEQSGIENVGAVGGGDKDDAFVGLEAVHFDEQGVESLLALVVTAAESCATMAADGVNFIDEDDAGRVLLSLLEEIAHAAGADAYKHFHEVRTGDGEEGNVGFAGDGACEKSLTGARRANEQDSFGNAPAEFLEALRVLQELDNFLELFLGFIGAGDVLERGFFLLRGEQTRARFAEAESFVAAGLHLAHQEEAEADEKNERRGVEKNQNPVAAANFLDIDLDVFIAQGFGDVRRRFLGNGDAELVILGADVFALQLVAVGGEVHRDFLDVPGIDLLHEFAVGGFVLARRLSVCRYQLPEHDAQEDNRHPEEDGLCCRTRVHVYLAWFPAGANRPTRSLLPSTGSIVIRRRRGPRKVP